MSALVNILTEAIALIECGWCQRAAARTPDGKPCGPGNPSAMSWCITAALYRRDYSTSALPHFEAEKLVRAALGFDAAGRDPDKRESLTLWNDNPARTAEDVLFVLRDARATALRAAMHLVPATTPARVRQLFVPPHYNDPVIIGWRAGGDFTPDDHEARATDDGVFMNVESNEDTPTIPPEPEDPS